MATTATPKAFRHDDAHEHDASALLSFSSSRRRATTPANSTSSSNAEADSLTHDDGSNGADPARPAAASNETPTTAENPHIDIAAMNVADDAVAASLQLHAEQSIQLLRTRRPLLHHLRAGPSWLLQLPRPVAATRRGARGFYNVLVNPRFFGRGAGEGEGEGEEEERGWVARAMGRGKSVDSIEDVQDLIGEIEWLTGRGKRGTESAVDAVVLSAPSELSQDERDALLQIDPDVPVFALEEAMAGINALEHFRHVSPIPPFSLDDPYWRAASLPPLPEWLAVSRLESPQRTTSSEPPSSSPLSSSSRVPALLFAFACAPPSSAAPSKPKARGANSARALLHHDGWASAGSTAEGAECIVFAAGSAHTRDRQANMGANGTRRGSEVKDANEGDALLSPDAIRAVAYACPSLAVAAVMAPDAHARGFDRKHAPAQRLLRARYWIDVGDAGDLDAAHSPRADRDGDAWVTVRSNAGAGAHAPRAAAAKWYTPWRWPGAGVRWLTGRGDGTAGDGRARGMKRGLDESDEEEDEEDKEITGGSENEAHDGAPRTDEAEEEDVNMEDDGGLDGHEQDSIDEATVDPWRGVRRCRLGGGASIALS